MSGNQEQLSSLWALVAAILVFIAALGVSAMLSGSSRRRVAWTQAGHVWSGFAGAAIGVAVTGYAIAYGQGNIWFGRQWFGLSGLRLEADSSIGDLNHAASLLALMAMSIFFTALIAAGMAERSTAFGMSIAGLLSGGLLLPVLVRSLEPAGLIGALSVGGESYFDGAGSASVVLAASSVATIASVIVGPRLGRQSISGDRRSIPVSSSWTTVLGSMFVTVGWFGVATWNHTWSDDLARVGIAIFLSVAGAVLIGQLAGRVLRGRPLDHDAHIYVMAGLSAMLPNWGDGMNLLIFVAIGAIAGLVSVLIRLAAARLQIDDPVGVSAGFGGGSLVGIMAVGVAGSMDTFLVQLTGAGFVVGWAIFISGLVLTCLNALGWLRVSRDFEVAGLLSAEANL